ncbi:MAG TPA: aryl-sulfate sulfotransferase [Bryobacteraceae bacterium]|nr:aryl-sulfate sulfotransferase [Bryobacteraceae bacterium]
MRNPLKYASRALSSRSWVMMLFLGAGCFSTLLHATITNVTLVSAPASPQKVGTSVRLTVSATDTDPGPLSYKWEVLNPGFANYSVVRDFSTTSTLTWAPNFTEGAYQIRVTARDYLAGTTAQHVMKFVAQPVISGSQPVAVATANPLVALFSAPTCPVGSTMAVVFQLQGSPNQTVTDSRPCHAGSQNFYIGGMQAQQTYTMHSQVTTGGTVTPGPSISFTTGSIPTSMKFPTRSVPVTPAVGADTSSDIVLNGYTTTPDSPFATDLSGNILWYYTTALQMTRPIPGGTLLTIPNGTGTGTGVWGPGITRQQLLREFDLVGNIVHETNCDRLYEQLQAMGLSDPLGRFNHDAIRLSNGQTMVVGDIQRIFPAGTQGSSAPIDIIGDVIIVLDSNFQVVYYWNAFDHDCAGSGCISINRKGNNTCTTNPNTGQTAGGCPPVLLSSPANDWLHINSIQYLTPDGDILASVRDQNWIAKIDYNNGTGTGDFLWRLGLNGDFTLIGGGGDPYPWFSGQHNPGFINDSEDTLVVFDNAAIRHSKYGGNSRGQVYTIDQVGMTATLALSADLGAYSPALGSAQVMTNGNYNFYAGDITAGKNSYEVQSTEVSPVGTFEYQFQAIGPAKAYRGWRLQDLYHASLNGSGGPE